MRLPAFCSFLTPQRQSLLRQFIQYVVVGGLSFVVDFTTLVVLTEIVHFHYLFSATAGFLLGLALNYLLCIFWIFDYRALGSSVYEFVLFLIIGIGGLLLNNTILFICTESFSIHYIASKLLAAGVVLAFNFLLRRHLLFSPTPYARWLQNRLATAQKTN